METAELREKLREVLSNRAKPGEQPKGDIQVLKPEFIDYTDDNVLTVDFEPQEWHENGIHLVQGGILSYMLDCVFGPFAHTLTSGKMSGTLDMQTNYLRPVFADGRKIRVEARLITNSKRTIHIEGKLYNGDGKVAVTASTNLMKAL